MLHLYNTSFYFSTVVISSSPHSTGHYHIILAKHDLLVAGMLQIAYRSIIVEGFRGRGAAPDASADGPTVEEAG